MNSIKSTIPIEIREPSGSELSTLNSQPSTGCVLDFISSDATLDRYCESIAPTGWKLDNYKRNPVFQNSHQYGDILFTLGRAAITEVRSIGGSPALFQRIEFACDVNPMAKIAYGLYKGKFLNAVSVGFVPIKWQDLSSSDSQPSTLNPQPSRRFLEQELLEVSAVAIPANPNALALGLKSGAVTKADLNDVRDLLRCIESTCSRRGDEADSPSHLERISRGDEAPTDNPKSKIKNLKCSEANLRLLQTLHKLLHS